MCGVECEARVARGARLTALLNETCLSTPASRLAVAVLLAAGTLSAAFPASATDFGVNNEATLRNAINAAKNGDSITFLPTSR